MRQSRKSAWYVMAVDKGEVRFLHINDVRGDHAIELTTCPHEATLFTNFVTADGLADEVRKIGTGAQVNTMPTRTSGVLVYSG